MTVAEIMTQRVQQVSADMAARDAWELMQRRRFHHLVVTHQGEIVGVLSDRDLGGSNGGRIRARSFVSDLMTLNTMTIGPRESVRRAANLMRGRAIGCLPVVDDEHLVGIVTVSDLIELVGRGIVTTKAKRPLRRTRPSQRGSLSQSARRRVTNDSSSS